MKLKLLAAAVLAIFRDTAPRGIHRGRAFTRDAQDNSAFQFRMGAGFPGDVNRTHPVSVEPCLIDTAFPPTIYGGPVLINNTADAANGPGGVAGGGVRAPVAGDNGVTTVYGFAVRPYPQQTDKATLSGGQVNFGAATLPVTGEIDIMRWGYIMAQLNDVNAKPIKGDPVFVWCAATAGIHVQGGIEVVASGANTMALDAARYMFNNGPDASGVVEIYAR